MKCRKCGSKNMDVMPNKKNPSATDLYCCDCGAWQKFATKDEIRLYSAPKRIFTNADRIRAMSDEELAELLCSMTYCYECRYKNACTHDDGYLEWLKQLVQKQN